MEEEEEEEERKERSSSVSEEKLLATQENYELGEGDEEKNERSTSDSEEKSNLEKLLATQENYELYCPSCSSCITRKVILKKRKRGKHVDSSPDLKPDVPVVEPSHIEEMEPPVKVNVPETRIEDDNQEDKEEGIIFNCLACLKYFIRLGTRFLQLDYITGKPVEEPVKEYTEVRNSINTTQSQPQIHPDRERFVVELLKSTVYGGLTETITSLGVVSSASASGSSTMNILALAVANLAGGLIVLAQNLQDLQNSSDQEKDRYEELLGSRANFRIHILVAVMSYIFFGLIPPLVYAFSFYETGIKNYKLISVFSVSLLCVILLGLIKVYVRKPPNSRESTKAYLKSAAYYTSTVVASCGISYVVGDIMGEYTGKLSLVGLDQISITSPCDGIIKPEECRFTSF
ncbi:hypothetical protein ISN44_As11g023690 [Arabidopsis suecica]|nr:hypothetical protein ISN44_As11g023690 [Arabidopsis suecica]